MSKDERRLAAVMFTDMVGYTSLSQANETVALDLLETQRRIIRPLLTERGGKEVKTIGDGFLAEFPSALEAVRCAFEIQQLIHEMKEPSAPGKKNISLRIGIHLGDVIHRGGDIYGDAVNIASRIEPLSPADGLCFSEQVFDLVRNKLEFPIQSLGKHNLKNVSLSIEVFKVVMPWQNENERVPTGKMGIRRIAVLPLANFSPAPQDEYFSDGLTEELISRMSKISGLQIIARTSVMRYKNSKETVQDIAGQLNVGAIIEGSVRKAGDKLRITIQLIDAENSQHIWSESYDREMRDVFAIQSDIAESVAQLLKIKIMPQENAIIQQEPTKNTEAYSSYLKGRQFFLELNESSVKTSIKYFENAIKLDPSFALPYAGLAGSYSLLGNMGSIPPPDALAKSGALLKKALELDEDLDEARLTLAEFAYNKYDWTEAGAQIERSLKLNPNMPLAHLWRGVFLKMSGRLDESMEEHEKALELDPFWDQTEKQIGQLLYFLRRYDKAIEYLNKVEERYGQTSHTILGHCYLQKSMFDEATNEFQKALNPSKGRADLGLAHLAVGLVAAGRTSEAEKILGDFEEVSKRQYIPSDLFGFILMALGRKDEAFKKLEQSCDVKSLWITEFLKVDPFWDPVREDPRFTALLRKMNFPPGTEDIG